jgi:Protein of unknown function (DUF732)
MIPGVSQPEVQRQVRQQRADIDALYELVERVDQKSMPWTSRSTVGECNRRSGWRSGREGGCRRCQNSIIMCSFVIRRSPGCWYRGARVATMGARADTSTMRITAVASGLCAAGVVLFGLNVDLAAPANASPTDDAFIRELDARGLSYSSPDEAIKNGRGVCSRIGSGIAEAGRYLQAHTNYNNDQMLSFGSVAIQAYCPQMASKL